MLIETSGYLVDNQKGKNGQESSGYKGFEVDFGRG